MKSLLALVLCSALGSTAAFAQTSIEQFPIEQLPSVAESASTGWSLTGLEAVALERNPTLIQAGAQVAMSRGKALQAGLWQNPNMGYAADQIGANGTAGELHGGFFEQQIITGGKLQLSRAKYAQEANQAQIQVLAQQYRVLYGVRAAFYETLVRHRRLELRRQLLQNAEDGLQTVEELVNVGQANRTDLLQAQVQLQRARATLQASQRRYQGAWDELTAVVGAPELATTSLEGALDFTDGDALDGTAALEELLRCSPELRFARAEVQRDRIGLERERVEPVPNVNLRAESGYNFESNNTVAGVEIGLRVPLFDRNQGTIMQARAELTRAQAEVQRVELLLRRRFAQVFADYEASLIEAKVYREQTLPQAEKLYQAYRDSFDQRRAAWPQVLDAQRDYYEMVEEYYDHVLDARRAEARLSTYLLDGGLDQPPAPTPQGHRDATPRPR